MALFTETKRLSFSAVQGETVIFNPVITHTGTSLTTVFPVVALENIIRKISVSPSERLGHVQDRIKAKRWGGGLEPCGGFSVAYSCTCEYHGLPFTEDVVWDVDTIYLSHNTKELNLGDFDHVEPNYLIPVISALEHNTWFTKLNLSNIKLSSDACNEVLKVIKKNATLEELTMTNTGIKWDFAQSWHRL